MQGWVEQFYNGVLLKLWPGLNVVPLWPLYIVAILAGAAVMLGWLSFMGIVGKYGERRIAGFIQVRLGPNRVGPFGLLRLARLPVLRHGRPRSRRRFKC